MRDLPTLYTELADWWPVLSAPEDYAHEAAFYRQAMVAACEQPPRTLLELGSGGGNNASHLKQHFEMTLVDLSPEMLAVSRALNPECEHLVGDMRTVRLLVHGIRDAGGRWVRSMRPGPASIRPVQRTPLAPGDGRNGVSGPDHLR